MAVKVKTRRGKEITLLNPAEKGRKCAVELKAGIHTTNDGDIKRDDFGNVIPLTDTQKAWRSGYLAARQDSADCHNAKNGIMSKKQRRGKRSNNLPTAY